MTGEVVHYCRNVSTPSNVAHIPRALIFKSAHPQPLQGRMFNAPIAQSPVQTGPFEAKAGQLRQFQQAASTIFRQQCITEIEERISTSSKRLGELLMYRKQMYYSS
ncbi:hypothetical protein [Tengunoibacter tsumagoiensis]|uniref:Uncharacterized protein n=1 Tax=Tengunoibacter tsumagoiensis TaxID=2014871 RepID=A0A401ZZ20_9CHLR|nr:hypothetical protein [Tengunoibacter tsumagoiensis]GCE12099.1 hypothetical protein KTT_19580 [Tengunoibacter tsumagoiensis]